jgi:hypothetical protein
MSLNTIKCDCGSPVDLDQTDWCDVCDKSIFAEPKNKIMTPKEQALVLYDEFFNNAESRNKVGLYDEDLHKYNTKRCALTAVNEMIVFVKHAFSYINIELATPSIVYLEEVKQEIEKL